MVNSGPIGGLVAARHVGKLLGYDKIITADMGGTSFDVGLIVDGVFEEESSPFLDQGLPVHVPSIKVVTIGAGGGSIAWTDGYRLQVGPQSAGADPGPACYGRGGEEPTVADALVVLGIIDPKNFFGGRYALDPGKARAAIERGRDAARARSARGGRRHLRGRHRQDGRSHPQGHGRKRPRSARVLPAFLWRRRRRALRRLPGAARTSSA